MARRAKAAPKAAEKYSVPFLTAEDGQLVGEELRRIAELHKVNDIRQLDAEVVFDKYIANNPRSPLRKLFNWDEQEAARRHWIDYTRKLISSVQIVTVSFGERKFYEQLFVSAEAPVRKPGSKALKRARVLRHDMLTNDPVFVSHVNTLTDRMLELLAKLEHLAAARPMPEPIGGFIKAVRTAAEALS